MSFRLPVPSASVCGLGECPAVVDRLRQCPTFTFNLGRWTLSYLYLPVPTDGLRPTFNPNLGRWTWVSHPPSEYLVTVWCLFCLSTGDQNSVFGLFRFSMVLWFCPPLATGCGIIPLTAYSTWGEPPKGGRGWLMSPSCLESHTFDSPFLSPLLLFQLILFVLLFFNNFG